VCVPENANLFTIFTINYIGISKKDRRFVSSEGNMCVITSQRSGLKDVRKRRRMKSKKGGFYKMV